MAEPNNHAEFKGSVAGQSFALSTKDIIPVLLLLSGLLGGYLLWTATDKRLERIEHHHARMFEILLDNKQHIAGQLEQIRKWFSTHDYNMGRPSEQHLPLDVLPPNPPTP